MRTGGKHKINEKYFIESIFLRNSPWEQDLKASEGILILTMRGLESTLPEPSGGRQSLRDWEEGEHHAGGYVARRQVTSTGCSVPSQGMVCGPCKLR